MPQVPMLSKNQRFKTCFHTRSSSCVSSISKLPSFLKASILILAKLIAIISAPKAHQLNAVVQARL